MGTCFRKCINIENENNQLKMSNYNKRISLLKSLNEENLKQTQLSNNNKKNSIFKNPYMIEIKNKGKIITEEEFYNYIPKEYLEKEKKNPYNLNKYSNNEEELIPEKPLIFNNNTIYYGNWNKESKFSGNGKMLILNEKIYIIGNWENGICNKGRIYYPNRIYEGEMSNNTFNGEGILKYNNGEIYEGNWKNGYLEGNGKMIFKDKKQHNCNCKNGEINGKGEMKFNNGIYYKGDFINGKFNGNGLLKNINNQWEYNGNFKNNLFNGNGKFIFNNGDSYEGNYLNNEKNGEGNYIFKKGYFFKGIWKNNIPEEGNFIINNITYICKFRNGIIYDIEIENGNNNFNDDIDLNDLKFQNENDDIKFISSFQQIYNSIGNEYIEN